VTAAIGRFDRRIWRRRTALQRQAKKFCASLDSSLLAPMMHAMFASSPRLALALAASGFVHAAQFVTDTNANAPKVFPASDEGERAMKRFRFRKVQSRTLCRRTMLANPVCFTLMRRPLSRGRNFCLHSGVTDIRGHMTWLTANSPARRSRSVGYMKEFEGQRIANYTKESDRVR